MTNHVRVDALVTGQYGLTERTTTMRVTTVSPFGWVAGVEPPTRQRIMYPGRFEVVGEPRPEKLRTDIPAHLRAGR